MNLRFQAIRQRLRLQEAGPRVGDGFAVDPMAFMQSQDGDEEEAGVVPHAFADFAVVVLGLELGEAGHAELALMLGDLLARGVGDDRLAMDYAIGKRNDCPVRRAAIPANPKSSHFTRMAIGDLGTMKTTVLSFG